ncbi:MAG: TetR family transcriptional regulator [Hydrocarboniphaga sp.]|uniref:TetR/AcrR family transcriptional regulator n=1 Tax=Hydrocarboniphaga sp. TaxID=2033016 RepID=UPI002617BF30|nr:TetR/AcrR family transcriptional regulator [Hydrocarboniphaga sp.]MDB5970054.1 TetR family transcriptional regulator [Hydrocarboniphaga sp.]
MFNKYPADDATRALTHRKAPQQKRSQMTVQSILQATMELAEAEGFLSLGTRRIAERAGISPGSLYQYFPTVEAILLTIYEETASRVTKKFRAKMLSIMEAPMETVGQKTLELLLKEYEANQLILHQMVIERPQLMMTPGAASLERLFGAGVRLYFSQFSGLNERDVERVSFFLDIVVIGSLRSYLSERPLQLSRKAFLDDLVKVTVSYVRSQNWKVTA